MKPSKARCCPSLEYTDKRHEQYEGMKNLRRKPGNPEEEEEEEEEEDRGHFQTRGQV